MVTSTQQSQNWQVSPYKKNKKQLLKAQDKQNIFYLHTYLLTYIHNYPMQCYLGPPAIEHIHLHSKV